MGRSAFKKSRRGQKIPASPIKHQRESSSRVPRPNVPLVPSTAKRYVRPPVSNVDHQSKTYSLIYLSEYSQIGKRVEGGIHFCAEENRKLSGLIEVVLRDGSVTIACRTAQRPRRGRALRDVAKKKARLLIPDRRRKMIASVEVCKNSKERREGHCMLDSSVCSWYGDEVYSLRRFDTCERVEWLL